MTLRVLALIGFVLTTAWTPDDEAETGRCLPPSVGSIVQSQLTGPVAAALPSSWKPGAVRITAHRIELEFDESGRTNRVALVAGSVDADGQGRRFSYRILQATSDDAGKTLLTVGSIIDAAVPDDGILSCETKPRRKTRAQVLVIGFAEAGVLLVSVWYALARGRRSTGSS